MSRIQRPDNATAAKLTEAKETPLKTAPQSAAASDSPKETFTTRVVFEANATAEQMQHGVIVQLANASHVFTAGAEDVDVNKGILTSINVKSIYSDCSEPVTFALNLYNASKKRAIAEEQRRLAAHASEDGLWHRGHLQGRTGVPQSPGGDAVRKVPVGAQRV